MIYILTKTLSKIHHNTVNNKSNYVYSNIHYSKYRAAWLYLAKNINTHGSRRRAHHLFRPHQLFFYFKKVFKKKYLKTKFNFFLFKTKNKITYIYIY